MEFDPSQFVRASGAADLLRVSLPRVYQLVEDGLLVPIQTPAGRIFRIADCLRLRRDRERRRVFRTRQGA